MDDGRKRSLYLVRHGRVAFPGGVRRCIGRTELPLDEAGRRQAEDLREYFRDHPVEKVFASPSGRCRETAEILAGGRYPVEVREGLSELDMGEWENVPLAELHKELESEPEQGEGRKAGLNRFRNTVLGILKETEGDLVCVAHAGVNCCFLSELLGTPLEMSRALPQPYGCLSQITVSSEQELCIREYGVMPKSWPDRAGCEEIWEHYRTPERVRRHCRAVAQTALELVRHLTAAGYPAERDLVEAGALLHDVARQRPAHAQAGADILRREGYPLLAKLVGSHHDLPEDGEVSLETEIVYLADKMVIEDQDTTVEERFAVRRRQCGAKGGREAEEACERRFQQALRVEQKIRRMLEKRNGHEIN